MSFSSVHGAERHWQHLGGMKRRAGIAAPLFSLHSHDSTGVGEFRDLTVLGDWCRSTGHSILQLLPLNDVGADFRPYDAQSAFALEPMHLALDEIAFVPKGAFSKDIEALQKKFPTRSFYFDTAVKKERLALLGRMFGAKKGGEREFARFREDERFWLEDYALFKVIKEKMGLAAWEAWPEAMKNRDKTVLDRLRSEEKTALDFHAWMQWQCFLQFSAASRALTKKGIFLMGDLPFLVSRDSADVWSHPHYFKLHLSAGAPPDLYFSEGQEWGMPPYDWKALETAGYGYWKERLKYAGNFYQLFRVDHFVGLFRVWTYPREGSLHERKAAGAFDPPEEALWAAQGEKILSMILENTSMLPCAEDLGTVPSCSAPLLERYAIPGMDVQRWTRDWKGNKDFLRPEQTRPNSIATLSTHDSTPFAVWWEKEASGEEKEKFLRLVGLPEEDRHVCSLRLVQTALETAARSRSVFCIQLLQDLFLLSGERARFGTDLRINEPGLVHERNWRLRLPFPLEEMKKLTLNKTLLNINKESERA